MKLKLKALAAAVALAVSAGAANAAIQEGPSGNSELVLFAFDVATNNTSMFDLGVRMNDFLPATAAVNNAGAQIQWNLSSGNITANSFASGYAGATGAGAASYGTALSQIAAYSDVRWGVIALDTTNPMRFLTTSSFTRDDVAATDIGALTSFSLSNSFLAAHNLLGTNPSAANGASYGTSGNALQSNGFGAEDWKGNMAVTATGAVGEQLGFYFLYSPTPGVLNVDQNAGRFDFNMSAGTLTYMAPVPEPGSYALMLAGLGMIGFMVRRRVR